MQRSEQSRRLAVGARRMMLWTGACVLVAFAAGCAASVHSTGFTVAQTFSISGTVSPATGGAAATLTLSGAATATTTANSSGAYSFSGLAAGTYAVTPSHTGFNFSPGTQSATIATSNVTGLDFTATAQSNPTFSISGTISPTAGGGGAAVLLSGPSAATTTTSATGSYTFSGLPNGAYSVTPSESGFTFTPSAQTVTLNGANQTGVNFIAASATTEHSVALTWAASTSTVAGYNIYRSTVSGSGYAKLNSSPIGGLSYSDASVHSGTTYFYVATSVDSGGDESTDSNQVSAVIP